MSWLLALRIVLLAVAIIVAFGVVARTVHRVGSTAGRMIVLGFSVAGFIAAMGWLA